MNYEYLFMGSTDAGSVDVAPDPEAEASGLGATATDTDALTTEILLPDDTLYMSRVYADKTISDCYGMLVSIRNSVLLLCMIVFLFEAHKIFKNAFKRHYKS